MKWWNASSRDRRRNDGGPGETQRVMSVSHLFMTMYSSSLAVGSLGERQRGSQIKYRKAHRGDLVSWVELLGLEQR